MVERHRGSLDANYGPNGLAEGLASRTRKILLTRNRDSLRARLTESDILARIAVTSADIWLR
jgi:hypothetical protein